MRKLFDPRLIAVAAIFLSQVTLAASNSKLPNGAMLPKGVKLPNDTAIAVYIPASHLDERFYVDVIGLWVEPGRALGTARSQGGQKFFTQVAAVEQKATGQYGLLVDIDPTWTFQTGNIHLELSYRVYDASSKEILSGKQSATSGINLAGAGGGFNNVANRAVQSIYADLLTKLQPSAEKFPATAAIEQVKSDLIVNRSRPVSTGTGFYINKSGQLLTAAHVLDDCLVIEAQRDEQTFPVKQRAISRLLDLAVMDSDRPTESLLKFRRGQELTLGEAVTNVGYPLAGILAVTPNLTRGNVSARGGLKGSVGLFQFSAPIQPGASGGPVVSDAGELLGVAVGTLNAASLVKDGILPQNVNFALEARHAAKFLRQMNVEFVEVEPSKTGDMQTANAAALGAVVQLSCYQ